MPTHRCTRFPGFLLVAGSLLPTPLLSLAEAPTATVLQGDPLPAGAVARLGMSGRELRETVGDGRPVRFLAVAPDSRTVATASFDEVRLWEVSTGREMRLLAFEPDRKVVLRDLVFGPDGKIVAVAGGDKQGGFVILWEPATGRQVQQLRTSERIAFRVAFAADGKSLYSMGYYLAQTWEVATGKMVREWGQRPDPPDRGISLVNLIVSPDCRKGIVKGPQRLHCLDIASGKELDLPGDLRLADAPLLFSPDGRSLVYWTWTEGGGVLHLQELATGKDRLTIARPAMDGRAAAFSPDGRYLVLTTSSEPLEIYEMGSGEPVAKLDSLTDSPVLGAFTPNGKYLVTAGRDTTALVWDVAELLKRKGK